MTMSSLPALRKIASPHANIVRFWVFASVGLVIIISAFSRANAVAVPFNEQAAVTITNYSIQNPAGFFLAEPPDNTCTPGTDCSDGAAFFPKQDRGGAPYIFGLITSDPNSVTCPSGVTCQFAQEATKGNEFTLPAFTVPGNMSCNLLVTLKSSPVEAEKDDSADISAATGCPVPVVVSVSAPALPEWGILLMGGMLFIIALRINRQRMSVQAATS